MHTLEISIQQKLEDGWPVIVEEQRGGGQLPIRAEGIFKIEESELLAVETDHAEYGQLLGGALFQGSVRDAFVEALARTDDRLRVLLFVEDQNLRGLRWERTYAPIDNEWRLLSTYQRTPFSRYMPSLTDRRFPPFGRRDLRALIVAYSPQPGNRFQLEPFDVLASTSGVQQSLGPIPSTLLADGIEGAHGRPTLAAIRTALTAEPYTLLHIVCHGRVLKDGESVMFLGGEDGADTVDPVTATRFIEQLSNLEGARGLPHFAFLSTCESASPDADEAMGGLGLRLVRDLGMPAVVAMTDKVSIATANALSTVIYTRLREHGEADRALVEASAGLAERGDAMVPVLFSRLGGRPLFSDTLDRALTPAELGAGLDQLAQLLPERAPVLAVELEQSAQVLRRSLDSDPARLSPEARQERAGALATIEAICAEATDLSFPALCLGEPVPAYDTRCPFPGLRAFRANARSFFFGREALVRRLTQRIDEHPFLAILGPSGSGKSSAIFAGLVPALQARNASLPLITFTPGDHPLAALAAALAPGRGGEGGRGRQGEGEQDGAGVPISPSPPLSLSPSSVSAPQSIIVVDQFEESFTLCQDKNERQQFFDELLKLPGQHLVIITMRADFFGEVAPYAALRDRVQARQELIAPMTPEELRRAMELQAGAVGLRFEADLSGTILDDVRGEPGAMPLLQHALQELWQRRRGRWLRAAEYRAIGGIQQAIAHTADEIFNRSTPEDKERIRSIFVRLTRLDREQGEAQRDTRQRVVLADLIPAGADPAPIRAVIGRLADSRLLVTGVSPSGAETVEVAHEALIRSWPRLRTWLTEDRQNLLLREAIAAAAADWEARKGDEGLLFRGARLDEAVALAALPRFALNSHERSFVDAAVALREREVAEREAVRQRELEQARALAAEQEQRAKVEQQRAEEARAAAGQLRQRALIAGAIAVVAGVAAVAALLFFGQAQVQQGIAIANADRANQQAATAEVARNDAVAQQQTAVAANSEAQAQRGTAVAEGARADQNATVALQQAAAAEAQASLGRGQPDRAMALALAAIESGNPLPRTYFTLAEAADVGARRLVDLDSTILATAFSPDGSLIAAGADDGTVLFISAADGSETRREQLGEANHANVLAFLPGRGGLLAGTSQGELIRFDAVGAQPFDGGDGEPINALALSPDGTIAYTASEAGSVVAWDTQSLQTLGELRPADGNSINDLALGADGTLYLALGDSTIRNLDPEGGDEISAETPSYAVGYEDEQTLINCPPSVMATIPETALLAIGCFGGEILLWDTSADETFLVFPAHDAQILSIAYLPEATQLVTSSLDQTVRLWDLNTQQELRRFSGHRSEVNSLAVSPDAQTLITGSFDSTLRTWDIADGQRIRTYSNANVTTGGAAVARISADGTELIVAVNGSAAIWPLEDGPAISTFDLPGVPFALSDDGAVGLIGLFDGNIQLWDMRAGSVISELPYQGVIIPTAFSPDGATVALAPPGEAPVIYAVADGSRARDLADAPNLIISGQGAFSPDGRLVAFGSTSVSEASPSALVWDTATGALVAQLPGFEDAVTSVVFSPDSRKLIAGSDDRSIQIWDIATQQRERILSGHTGGVKSVAISADGTLILSGSVDRTMRLWDIGSSQELARFEGSEGDILSVVFGPDNQTAISASGKAEVILWRSPPPAELVTWVRANRYVPELSCEELAQYGLCTP